jgi:hypothetical protein
MTIHQGVWGGPRFCEAPPNDDQILTKVRGFPIQWKTSQPNFIGKCERLRESDDSEVVARKLVEGMESDFFWGNFEFIGILCFLKRKHSII